LLHLPSLAAVNKKVVEVVKEDFITSKQKGPDAGRWASNCAISDRELRRPRQDCAVLIDTQPLTFG
jgi:hypothetical protein